MTQDPNPPHSLASTDQSHNNNNFQTSNHLSIIVFKISKLVPNSNNSRSSDLEINRNNPQMHNSHLSFKILINNFLTQEEFLKLQDSQLVQIQYQILNFLAHQFLVSNSKEIHLILKGH